MCYTEKKFKGVFTMSNTIKLSCKTKPLMVAHRGVSGLEKENTHGAFIAAGNRSYYGIETDIYRTIDGQYVCLHDSNTSRVGIDNIDVTECTYETIRNLKLCGMSGEKDRNDICIPTLGEYIQICKRYEKVAVVELKQIFSMEQLNEIRDIIKAQDWLDHTVFIAFGLENLITLRQIDEKQTAQYLISGKYYREGGTDEALIDTLNQYDLDLDIRYDILTKELAQAVHDAGKKINVWTVNDLDYAVLLSDEMQVDYITSNILE